MTSGTAHLGSTVSEAAHLHKMSSGTAHLHRMISDMAHLFSDTAHLHRMSSEMAHLHGMSRETTLPSSPREACGDCCQHQLPCFTRIAGFTTVIHREEEDLHSQEMYTDRPPMAYEIDASIHGLDTITTISSIRLALLPFQSLYHPQEIHRIATHLQRQPTRYRLPLQSPLNSQ